jgi:hypothetical protein
LQGCVARQGLCKTLRPGIADIVQLKAAPGEDKAWKAPRVEPIGYFLRCPYNTQEGTKRLSLIKDLLLQLRERRVIALEALDKKIEPRHLLFQTMSCALFAQQSAQVMFVVSWCHPLAPSVSLPPRFAHLAVAAINEPIPFDRFF